MKKIISCILIMSIMVNITACSNINSGDTPNGDPTIDSSITDNNDGIEIESNTNNKSEDYTIDTGTVESENTTVKEYGITENMPYIDSTSGMKTSEEYSGMYSIKGYSSVRLGDKCKFTMDISNGDNVGALDLSKCILADDITEYIKYIVIYLEFKNDALYKWDIVDELTGESIIGLSNDELNTFYVGIEERYREAAKPEIQPGLEALPEYNGYYELTGTFCWSFDDLTSLGVSHIDSNNTGSIDLSECIYPELICTFSEYLYIYMEFSDNKIVEWDVVDRATGTSVKHWNSEEMRRRYEPEKFYDKVECGELPSIIKLSEYPAGKIYIFDLNPGTEYREPMIINDSTDSIVFTSFVEGLDGYYQSKEYWNSEFNWERYRSKVESDDNKFCVAIGVTDTTLISTYEYSALLDNIEVGSEIEYPGQFLYDWFVVNNTDKIAVLEVETYDKYGYDVTGTAEVELLPGEIINFTSDMMECILKSLT